MQFMTYSVPADVELFVKGKSLVLLDTEGQNQGEMAQWLLPQLWCLVPGRASV